MSTSCISSECKSMGMVHVKDPREGLLDGWPGARRGVVDEETGAGLWRGFHFVLEVPRSHWN